jgi:hypothetical protein
MIGNSGPTKDRHKHLHQRQQEETEEDEQEDDDEGVLKGDNHISNGRDMEDL